MEQTDKEKLYALIETWEASNITIASKMMKSDKDLALAVEKRYKRLIQSLGGASLRILAKLPQKWEKLKNYVKISVIANWPQGCPFITKELMLNGKLSVNSWRESRYTNQIERFYLNNIAPLKEVTAFHLAHQQLKELPTTIGKLPKLEILNLEDNKLTALPASIGELKTLKVLNLSQNYGLKTLPAMEKLLCLEELDLTYTDIATLPESFFELPNIKKVVTLQSELDRDTAMIRRLMEAFPNATIVSNAKEAITLEEASDEEEYKGKETIKINEFNLNTLPASLFKADVVKELTIDCYNLKELPDQFDQLTTLEKLHLKIGNNIQALPLSITKLKNLRFLYVEGFGIKSLPSRLSDLENLTHLELENTAIEELPTTLSELQKLHTLIIKRGKLQGISAIIGGLKNLQKLFFKNISLPKDATFPIDASLQHLTALEEVEIEVRGGKMTETLLQLPKTLKKLSFKIARPKADQVPALKLDLGKVLNHFNQVTNLSLEGVDLSTNTVAITPHTALTTLGIYYCYLPQLPDSMHHLEALTEFSLFSSKLEDLPQSLYGCKQLRWLRFTNTAFETIPEGIEQLEALTHLIFERSNISALPHGIFELKNLKELRLGDCPLFSDQKFKAKIKRKIKGLKVTKDW